MKHVIHRDSQSQELDSHQIYEKLCALASSGGLSSDEWRMLAAHLKICAVCRKDVRNYQEIATFGMSLIAPSNRSLEVEAEWSPESAVAKLMQTLQKQQGSSQPSESETAAKGLVSKSWLPLFSVARLRVALSYAGAVTLIATISITLYVASTRMGERRVTVRASSAVQASSTQEALLQQRSELERGLRSRTEQMEQMAKQIEEQRITLDGLRSSKQSVEETLSRLMVKSKQQEAQNSTLRSQFEALDRDRSSMAEQLKDSAAKMLAVEQNYQMAREQHAGDLAQITKLQGQIDSASHESHAAAYVEARQLSESEPDLRSLMGARDLFIADVYDIDKAGSPRKPFGRVFYTRGKSLLFYAFDLDKQPGVKSASTFQVWGRRGYGDTHPINMGRMYLDSETSRRWVLKYDDAKALAQVDAVFVTIEPHGGSEVPKGPQLLYASLRTPPNHP